jgi:plasmid stabilization system protein ParE
MKVIFRPEARAEALEAREWYESRAPGLGFEFARALDAALAAAVRNPGAFVRAEGECRRITLRRFPYFLIYRAQAGTFLVVSVFHHRREPHAWLDRVGR